MWPGFLSMVREDSASATARPLPATGICTAKCWQQRLARTSALHYNLAGNGQGCAAIWQKRNSPPYFSAEKESRSHAELPSGRIGTSICGMNSSPPVCRCGPHPATIFVQPVPSLWMAPISSLNSVSLPAIYCGSSSGHASNILHPWRINASGNSFALSYVLVGCLSDWAGRQNNRRAKIATSSLGDISALWLTSLPEASIMRATLF